MKDYYEVLEVSRNASKEIIEKAYRVLVKKYHPDLQQEENKKKAEQKMKLINEAYEILCDDEKRKQYDEELKQNEAQKIINENTQKETKTYNENTNYNSYSNQEPTNEQLEELRKQNEQMRRKYREYQEEQDRIYRSYLRSLGYKIKEGWTFKKFLKLLEVIAILIIVFLILWVIPPTRKMMIDTYEQTPFLKAIIDVIINIVQGIGNGIGQFFKNIFGK